MGNVAGQVLSGDVRLGNRKKRHPFCDKEVIMTIGGHTDLYVGWGRSAEDEREGSKHSHLNLSEWYT